VSPKKIILFALLLLAVLGLIKAYWLWQDRFGVPLDFADEPVDFAKEEDHFKYGSIGSDNLTRGLPFWIWKVLPEMFPEHLPQTGKGGYEAFGLIVEPGIDRPIGFSKRRIWNYIDFVGPNCAFCHVSTIRKTADGPPETVLGMPGNTVDIEKFFFFLFDTAKDRRFTVSNVMRYVERANPDMGFMKRMVYRVLVYIYRRKVICLSREFDFLKTMPEFGPGRVETWTPYKRTLLVPALPVSAPGITDFPPIWNQKVREELKLRLHWDGNNPVLLERNLVAASGVVGRDLKALDLPRLRRVTKYIENLKPPKYKEMIPEDREDLRIKQQELIAKGIDIYQKNCFECHDPGGERFDKVERVERLGTDRNRVDAFTEDLEGELNKVGPIFVMGGTDSWMLRNFKRTKGYVNTLLDGIWLRAPYLHNGSVPTLRDLLKKPDQRPKKFYRGNDVYDWDNVGFKWDVPEQNGRTFFLYDSAEKGNDNGGHIYGTELPEDEKDALIEYLKAL
jgi:processive rubber oxygenase RoxA-like protein